ATAGCRRRSATPTWARTSSCASTTPPTRAPAYNEPSDTGLMPAESVAAFHATTVVAVRHRGQVALAGDGQVTIGQTIVKASARKVRKLYNGGIVAGFAGAAADAFTLFARFEALLAVADREHSFIVSGTGDVIEPDAGLMDPATMTDSHIGSTLTPAQIVTELDRYIVGQEKAKRAVAIALRNRWRRQSVPPELRDEVAPKNIIMIGPTGVGKTEVAR